MKENAFFRPPDLKERKIHVHGRKWTPAPEPIRSMDELKALIAGRGYIFHRTKGYHYGWIQGWQFSYISRLIDSGQLFAGVRSRHVPYTWRALWMHSRVPDLVSEFWVSCDELRGLEVKSASHAYIVRRCLEVTRKATGNGDARVHVVFRGEDER
jgi:hypothetical protein